MSNPKQSITPHNKQQPIDDNQSELSNLETQQIISQQIDVFVMGSCSLQLIEMLIGTPISKSNKITTEYDKLINKILSNKGIDITYDVSQCTNYNKSVIQKYSTIILTKSLWIHYNFYHFGNKAYDPFLSNILRGNMSICLLVQSEHNTSENSSLKSLITNQEQQLINSNISNAQIFCKNNRNEIISELSIINNIHSLKLSQFNSLLSLRMLDNGRVIEQVNTLQLTRNQILRWILYRHFENNYSVRLNQQLGDQLEMQQCKEEVSYCQIV